MMSFYKKITYISAMFALFISSANALAGPLIYTPSNPSFGGNPFNSSHLMGVATAQKHYEAPKDPERDPIDEFSEDVTRSLLSQLSRNIADSILGEDAKDSGSFIIGDTTLDFERINDDVSITIGELSTGKSTTITLPVTEF